MTEHQSNDPQAGGAPPPPPQGQPVGTPPPGQGAPPAQQPMPVQEGVQPPVANLLSYLLGFIGGLIMFLTQKNQEVRFHGMQAILLDVTFVVGLIVVSIVSGILGSLTQSFLIFALLSLVWFAVFIGWGVLRIIGCVQGYQQRHFKLPVIGDFAERFARGAV